MAAAGLAGALVSILSNGGRKRCPRRRMVCNCLGVLRLGRVAGGRGFVVFRGPDYGVGRHNSEFARLHGSRACRCADRSGPGRHTRVHHLQWHRRLSSPGHRACSFHGRRRIAHDLQQPSAVIAWSRPSSLHHAHSGAEQSRPTIRRPSSSPLYTSSWRRRFCLRHRR